MKYTLLLLLITLFACKSPGKGKPVPEETSITFPGDTIQVLEGGRIPDDSSWRFEFEDSFVAVAYSPGMEAEMAMPIWDPKRPNERLLLFADGSVRSDPSVPPQKTANTRYFYFSYAANNCASGYYSCTMISGFPSKKEIVTWIENKYGKINPVITGIYEFKSEQDYDNFIK